MPTLGRGETSSDTNPVLDIWTAVGNPSVLTNIIALEFRIFDITTAAKKITPLQVFPVTPGTFFTLDPLTDAPTGHRLSTGRYYAPFTVDASEPLGDHQIEWRFQQNALSPVETFIEEFCVTAAVAASGSPTSYCSITEVRAEGYTDPPFSDARISTLILLASKYVDKVTGRWFGARTFDETNPMVLDGRDSRSLHLSIPIIRLDKLEIENQGFINTDLTEIDLSMVRAYNRHVAGMTQPDDRENPRIAFIQTRIPETVLTGLFPAPRTFPLGRQNIHLQGVFGYTDPDGTSFGNVPELIRQVTCRLVTRDLLLDSDACEKLNIKQKFRISSDKEGSTTVKLTELWLKGAFTGDPEIDNILMLYKRPPRIGIA